MTLTFFTNPMSRGRIVRWMLEEVGCDYETVVVPWGDKPQALLDANPLGKVPTIVHDGRTVTEGAAICAYLAETFPDAGLAPTADERADYYRWLFFAAGPIEQAITDRNLGLNVPPEKRMMVGYGDYDSAVDTLELAVGRHDYIAGDRFTAADVYVGSQVLWGLGFKTLPERPAFTAYAARLNGREAYRRAGAKDDALMPPATGHG
jgi:glutathione S-transferase